MPTGKPRDPRKERFWRRAIKRWRQSGLTAQAFCTANGLSPASLYGWQRILAQRDAETVPFAQVHVLTEKTNSPCATTGSTFEVVLANGRMLRISADFDADGLRRLLPLLEEASAC
jgi:hypothetical protein